MINEIDFFEPAIEFFEAGKVITHKLAKTARTVLLCTAVGTAGDAFAVEIAGADLSSSSLVPSVIVHEPNLAYEQAVASLFVADRGMTFGVEEGPADPFGAEAMNAAWSGALALMQSRGQDVNDLLARAASALALGVESVSDPIDDEA